MLIVCSPSVSKAVSYTHLDVYKRQIQINANGRIYTKINSSIAEPELSSVPVYSTPASFSIGSKFESGRYGV